ncbi:MAG: hypothetical protein WAU91_20345 [Desulfatitalea sp.]
MFKKKLNAIVVVHNETVYWITCNWRDSGRRVIQMPLEQVLTDSRMADQIPATARGNYKTMCIVPDHWFGRESYPFQSPKHSLIEPFLERKLSAAYPELKAVRYFFDYKRVAAGGGGNDLLAYFLQDEKAYRLYDALAKMNVAPRQITTPAFLWVDRLTQVSPDFEREGTLLVHMGTGECLLYFYFKGNHLFSRNVVLSTGPDRMEALTFEINQSLYMFSQKTKSELNRIYLLAASPDGPEAFIQALGREVIDLNPLLADRPAFEIDAVPLLDGLLPRAVMFSQAPFFSVTQRQAQRELVWEPVQWAGVVIGIALLIPLLGENLLLGNMLRTAAQEKKSLRQSAGLSDRAPLEEYESELDSVLGVAERPVCADTVRRILASLPAGMRVQELGLALEAPAAVTLRAVFPARDAEQLKAALAQLVARLKTHFKTAPDFSISNIEIGMDPHTEGELAPQYVIALRLEMI